MSLIRSKNTLGANGFQVGGIIEKDMEYGSCPALDSAYAPNGIAITSAQSQASYWNDWGNDVFDEWGYFYIFNPATNQYYFPQITPINEPDEQIYTQTFSAFSKNFTIKQGYPAQGIFKFEVTCIDPTFTFIFGFYGEMGSDANEINTNLTQNYSFGGNNYTLYYNENIEEGDFVERLYSYVVPYQTSKNNTKTYSEFVDNGDLSIFSVPLQIGVTVYFSKQYDVKDWVINDLTAANQKITQKIVFEESLTKSTAWKGYRFYQLRALKYAFVRLEYEDYRKLYRKNRNL